MRRSSVKGDGLDIRDRSRETRRDNVPLCLPQAGVRSLQTKFIMLMNISPVSTL